MGFMNKLMRTVLLVSLVLSVMSSQGQTWAEFFKQKKTQTKYSLKQLAGLQLYLEYLRKGYGMVSGGLSLWKDISGGEFSLHDAFISSLRAVSPLVRDNAKVAEILACGLSISRGFGSIDAGRLSPSDWAYVQLVKGGVLGECGKDLEELLLVVTSGKLEMTGDERMERLERVYRLMLEKMAFSGRFLSEVSELSAFGERELLEIGAERRAYGIN